MSSDIPALRGSQLYRLLLTDGWEPIRHANHGIFMTKRFGNIRRTTIVKNTRAIIPSGTLGAILGPRQTGLGRAGLRRLISQHGIRYREIVRFWELLSRDLSTNEMSLHTTRFLTRPRRS